MANDTSITTVPMCAPSRGHTADGASALSEVAEDARRAAFGANAALAAQLDMHLELAASMTADGVEDDGEWDRWFDAGGPIYGAIEALPLTRDNVAIRTKALVAIRPDDPRLDELCDDNSTESRIVRQIVQTGLDEVLPRGSLSGTARA